MSEPGFQVISVVICVIFLPDLKELLEVGYEMEGMGSGGKLW